MPKWRRDSIFGAGPRQSLCREKRAQFRAKLDLARRAGRLTFAAQAIGLALLKRLGEDGRLDPALATIAADAAVSPATVARWLPGLRLLGFVSWTRRLVREGWRTEQTSNAYILTLPACDSHGEGATLYVLAKKVRYPQATKAEADASSRESAIRQLLALGLPVPAGW